MSHSYQQHRNGLARSRAGFTLIELLVVIAIIGVLATLVIGSLQGARTKSRDSRRVADLKQFQLALQLYFTVNGGYVPVPTANTPIPASSLTSLVPVYLPVMPQEPTAGKNYYYVSNGTSTSTATAYCIGATTENAPPTSSCSNSTFITNLASSLGSATNEYTVGP